MDPQGFFQLIVRGGRGVTATHDGSTLTVRFRRSQVGAGGPRDFGRMPHGSGAWVDRPMNDAEPTVLKQLMDQSDAATVAGVLRNGERFWMFLSSNTNNGFMEVFRSEQAFHQVVID